MSETSARHNNENMQSSSVSRSGKCIIVLLTGGMKEAFASQHTGLFQFNVLSVDRTFALLWPAIVLKQGIMKILD